VSRAPEDAARAYTERRDRLRELEARTARIERWISHARLAVFGAGLLLAWLAFGAARVSGLWPGLALATFAVLVVAHDAAIRRRARLARARSFHEEGLRRCEGTWVGRGRSGDAWSDAAHLYSADLDVFGRGSLFERLCVARTQAGEACLAGWLTAPAGPETLRERQASVAELAARLDLREDLAVEGDTARSGLRVEALRAWGEAPVRLAGAARRAPCFVLPLVSVAALGAWLLGGQGALPFGIALLVQMGYARLLRTPVRAVLHDAESAARDLGLAAALLERVERETFRAPGLRAITDGLDGAGSEPASRRIARLGRLQGLVDARRNQIFAPLAGLLLWSTHLAFAIEAWRAQSGAHIAGWVDALARLEALASLATFAHEESSASFPEIREDERGVVFRARGLAHPLLPPDRRVANDVVLDAEHRAWIVSGSNMSGKSTLLRAVGVNAVLALAGAPVCAERLEIGALRIGVSIQLRDSLLEGRSRFYAEIERLRDVTRAAEAGPLLFLLDEVLHGTNSRDRAQGAEVVVRGLLARGASGLATTHDLALTRLAEMLPGAENVHFVDHFEDGALRFDYRLRPGVLERGNALELMRAVGLDVDAAS